MATTDDIDTKAAVSKFLASSSVIDKEDPAADSADEIQAVLESVALSFLLYPQAALSFVLQAKNVLQQVVTGDLALVDYMIAAIKEINNPDEPVTDTSDLINAQTALVEVDRIGRVSDDVRAYGRYTSAISSFLNNKLAKTLKRNKTGQLERTGTEAKQDLFRALSAFGPTHSLMITKLGQLLGGVDDFNSVALTKVVATKTLTRVRASLNKVIQGAQKNQLSKTVMAIELLAGAAALSSISNTRKINDPTVDTGNFPAGRTISVSSQRLAAVATGNGTPVDLSGVGTPWTFVCVTDPLINGGTSYSITLPTTGASGRAYVKAATGSATFNIPAGNRTLYVEFGGITPPLGQPVRVRAVTLPTGPAITFSAVLSALNDVSTGLIDGTAVELAPGTKRLVIYGSSSVTQVVIRGSVPGTFDGSGNYIPPAGSAHSILGFVDEQTSAVIGLFSPADTVDILSVNIPTAEIALTDSGIQISSFSEELLSSLLFTGISASQFGFPTSAAVQPTYLELVENGTVIDPNSLGVFVGSVFTVSDITLANRALFAPVAVINGTELQFDPSLTLPRCTQADVRVLSPLVYAVQSLYDALRPFRKDFDSDNQDTQRVLSPLLSSPTLAQINDAKNALALLRTSVNDLLMQLVGTVVRDDQTEFSSIADQISSALEERGLDRALTLLQGCQFSDFFALTNEDASTGTRFLKASEQVGRNDLASTTVEQNMDDLRPKATTPDQNLLPGEELLEDEEQQ